jgi:hypothetical protein
MGKSEHRIKIGKEFGSLVPFPVPLSLILSSPCVEVRDYFLY